MELLTISGVVLGAMLISKISEKMRGTSKLTNLEKYGLISLISFVIITLVIAFLFPETR